VRAKSSQIRKRLASFPFARTCVLIQSFPACGSHLGIEAYTYTPRERRGGGKWRIRIRIPSSLPTFHFVGFASSFLQVPSLMGTRLFRPVQSRHGIRDEMGSPTGLDLRFQLGSTYSGARLHLHPATLERVPPCIHHSCVNRDFQNVIEAWTRHGITACFRETKNNPEVLGNPSPLVTHLKFVLHP